MVTAHIILRSYVKIRDMAPGTIYLSLACTSLYMITKQLKESTEASCLFFIPNTPSLQRDTLYAISITPFNLYPGVGQQKKRINYYITDAVESRVVVELVSIKV